MLRLRADLDSMDLPELLQTLEANLDRITSIVRTYPEARQTLALTIDRLAELNAQMQQLSSNEINQMTANPIPSNT